MSDYGGRIVVCLFVLFEKKDDLLLNKRIVENSYIMYNFKKYFHIIIFFVSFFKFFFPIRKFPFHKFSQHFYTFLVSVYLDTASLTIFFKQEIVNIMEFLLHFILLFKKKLLSISYRVVKNCFSKPAPSRIWIREDSDC